MDAPERLQVLLKQEVTFYQTTDYLTRMQVERETARLQSSSPLAGSIEDETLSPNKKRKSIGNETQDSPNKHCASSPSGPPDPSNSQINKHWREKICEWAYQGKHCHLPRATKIPDHRANISPTLTFLLSCGSFRFESRGCKHHHEPS